MSKIFIGKPRKPLEEWVKSVVHYNVPHGKQIRGKMVVMAYRTLSGKTEQKKIEDAQVVGWCVEILQASCLIADDLMDNGTSRRGRPCWHKVENIGITAVNDAFLLENLGYQIIRQRFRGSKIYADLLDLLLGVTFNTILGQSLDTRFSKSIHVESEDCKDDSLKELYNSITTLKTSYYTIYLPIALAMVLAGFGNANDDHYKHLWSKFEMIAQKIGKFFQIQDDYFDCFADEKKTGKMGSDIQEGKCSWLYVKSMELCSSNPLNLKILKENYGKLESKCISRIKALYLELDLSSEFRKTQDDMEANIVKSIYLLITHCYK